MRRYDDLYVASAGENFATTIFCGRYKWWLLVIAGLLFIAFQVDLNPRTDDEYLGEQVYWLLKKGVVQSHLGYSHLGYDHYQSVYHKLYIYSGYLSCRLSGWSLFSLHIVSLLCFILFVFVWYLYTRQDSDRNFTFFSVLTFMLFNQDILYAAGSFRPEIMVMVLGFVSHIELMGYVRSRKRRFLLASALCAGLCMFAHLNGMIFIIAGCLFLSLQKMYKAALLYGLLAGFAFSPYFADVLCHADLNYFRKQFCSDPVLSAQIRHWYDPLLRLLNEQSRFLFNGKLVIFTITLLLILGFTRSSIKVVRPGLLTYTLILVGSLALICPSKSTKYTILYLPFLYMILAEGWRQLEAAGNKPKTVSVRILLATAILISIVNSAQQMISNIATLRSGGLIAEHTLLARNIKEPHSMVGLLAPRVMVFDEIGKFKHLQDIGLVASENFKAYIRNPGVDYVIFSQQDRSYFNTAGLLTGSGSMLRLVDSTAHYWLAQIKR